MPPTYSWRTWNPMSAIASASVSPNSRRAILTWLRSRSPPMGAADPGQIGRGATSRLRQRAPYLSASVRRTADRCVSRGTRPTIRPDSTAPLPHCALSGRGRAPIAVRASTSPPLRSSATSSAECTTSQRRTATSGHGEDHSSAERHTRPASSLARTASSASPRLPQLSGTPSWPSWTTRSGPRRSTRTMPSTSASSTRSPPTATSRNGS